jgi:methylated-DNA-protein-cysteine methyltransferase-like protein
MTHSPADAWSVSGPTQERIYQVVRQIPPGKVSTYGDVAAIVGDCTARMVGYAMSSANDTLPWHRVINAQGKISPRGDGGGAELQRVRLEEEGVGFNSDGKVNFKLVRWLGPSTEWKVEHGFDPTPKWRE